VAVEAKPSTLKWYSYLSPGPHPWAERRQLRADGESPVPGVQHALHSVGRWALWFLPHPGPPFLASAPGTVCALVTSARGGTRGAEGLGEKTSGTWWSPRILYQLPASSSPLSSSDQRHLAARTISLLYN
jgi:hypothetical protein